MKAIKGISREIAPTPSINQRYHYLKINRGEGPCIREELSVKCVHILKIVSILPISAINTVSSRLIPREQNIRKQPKRNFHNYLETIKL